MKGPFICRNISRGGLEVRSRPQNGRVPGSKPGFTKGPQCMWACCTPNNTQGTTRLPTGVVHKFEKEVAAHVSAFCGSKSLSPSQNSQPSRCFNAER
ncbi:hypothetical protein AVEN_38989-1 [Araneus ventricosus]|uniref:Uncharacterized protein n=1 Tax=Araneus ventricosus TaxID=182803 RepID=A0A4Y2DRH5_ARAVE|nr:hypothetical protein AVEN_38989-1 [Araneus ventricosus]